MRVSSRIAFSVRVEIFEIVALSFSRVPAVVAHVRTRFFATLPISGDLDF